MPLCVNGRQNHLNFFSCVAFFVSGSIWPVIVKAKFSLALQHLQSQNGVATFSRGGSSKAKKMDSQELDWREKYAACCIKTKEFYMAKTQLEAIPESQRTIRQLNMLAKAADELGDYRLV